MPKEFYSISDVSDFAELQAWRRLHFVRKTLAQRRYFLPTKEYDDLCDEKIDLEEELDMKGL